MIVGKAPRLARLGFGIGVIIAAHFAPLALTREQRERLLLAMAGRDRSEVEWVEDTRLRPDGLTGAEESVLWVAVLPTLEELRHRRVSTVRDAQPGNRVVQRGIRGPGAG